MPVPLGGEFGYDDSRSIAPPIFFSVLRKRKRAVHGPKEKAAFLPRSGTFVPPRDGGLPNRCRPDLPAFCRLAPGRSVEPASSRVSGAEVVGVVNALSLLLNPLPLHGPARGPFQRADTQVRPYGRTRNRHRLVGADLCVGPNPAREGQRQRKEKRTVSPTSPGLDDPKGSAFPSLTAAREGQPSLAGGRRSAPARTDPPKHFFSSTGRGAFSF